MSEWSRLERSGTREGEQPSLPANRAFVVQFQGTPPGAPPTASGRAEHVASGRATRFDSWDRLRRFIELVLADVATGRR